MEKNNIVKDSKLRLYKDYLILHTLIIQINKTLKKIVKLIEKKDLKKKLSNMYYIFKNIKIYEYTKAIDFSPERLNLKPFNSINEQINEMKKIEFWIY